jgi:hypothetical protein
MYEAQEWLERLFYLHVIESIHEVEGGCPIELQRQTLHCLRSVHPKVDVPLFCI